MTVRGGDEKSRRDPRESKTRDVESTRDLERSEVVAGRTSLDSSSEGSSLGSLSGRVLKDKKTEWKSVGVDGRGREGGRNSQRPRSRQSTPSC